MSKEPVTIAGSVFNVPNDRYSEGDTITANEASALNQTYRENIRNNFASRVKEAQDAAGEGNPLTGDVLTKLQSELDEYVETYEFGVRGGGGGPRDPVMSEAMELARDAVRKALVKSGKRVTGKNADYTAAQISEAAKKLLAGPKGQTYMDLAKARVAESQKAAEDAMEAIGGAIAA